MALLVHDELNTPGTGWVPLSADWSPVPGLVAPQIGAGANSMPRAATMPPYTSQGGAYWSRDAFNPDHYSEISHNPRFVTGAPVMDGGPSVRQSPTEDSCYAVFASYAYGSQPDIVSFGHLYYKVVRINRGVFTTLALIERPGRCWSDDYWFGQLQVWGSDPVRLRVVSKAPSEYVLGTANSGSVVGLSQLPSDAGYLIGGVQYSSESWRDGLEPGMFDGPAHFTAPANGAETLGQWDEPGVLDNRRSWIVWEGQDTSPDRLRTGQPGIRFGPDSAFNISKFTAGELNDRLTARLLSRAGSAASIGGYRKPGTTITVT